MTLTPRLGFTAGFCVCAGLLGFAYYLQYAEMQEPCPLCMVQRVVFYVLAALFSLAAVHGPARRGVMLYGVTAFVVAALGAAVAARHVWLQHLPKHLVPSCGPDLGYMLKHFPFTELLTKVLTGSGECAEAGWKFLGLTIAGWSLFWLVALGLFALFLALRKSET